MELNKTKHHSLAVQANQNDILNITKGKNSSLI